MKQHTYRLRSVAWGAVLSTLVAALPAWAVEPFAVRDIRVEGLQRVEPGTVFASLPFRVGDTITIGNLTGTVSRIHTRATTVLDYDQKEVLIPNKTFITSEVVNWTLNNTVTRLILRVDVGYDSDPAQVHALAGRFEQRVLQLTLQVGRHPLAHADGFRLIR